MRNLGRISQAFLLPLVLFSLWWLLSSESDTIYFPALKDVLTKMRDWAPEGWSDDLLPSLESLALGLTISIVSGITLGLLLGLVPVARQITAPVIHFARSIPPPALLPLFVVLLGIETTMKVAVIATGAVWPILLSTIDGVQRIEPTLTDVARVFRVSRARQLLTLVIPGAAPSIAAGIRTSLGIGVILIVISELVASTEGIGYYIINSQRSFRLVDMWVGIIVMGLVGFVLSSLYAHIQRRVIFWTDTGAEDR